MVMLIRKEHTPRSEALTAGEKPYVARFIACFPSIRAAADYLCMSHQVLIKIQNNFCAAPASIAVLREHMMPKIIAVLVCREFGITEDELLTKKPDAEVTLAKQAAIYLLRKHTDMTRQQICDRFEYQEKRQVNSIVQRVEGYMRVNNENMREVMGRLVKELVGV